MIESTASFEPTATPAVAGPVTPAPTAAGRGAGRFGRQLGFVLSGLPIGLAAFVVLLAGFAAGAVTFVVLLGVPILVATLAAARHFAEIERRRVAAVTGRVLPPHAYREPAGEGFKAGLRALRDPQSWRDLAHALVSFPLRVVSFCLAVTWTVGGLGELLYVVWSWSIPRDPDTTGLLDLMFGISSRAADIAFNTGIGVLLLASAVPLVRALVAVQAGLARGLLTDETAALQVRTEQLALGRRSAVAAEAQTLRRLERDLHDGPQQRLVRLTMDLETVARRLDDDPDRARPLVAEMISQSHEALSELRALSRGIAPPILADRGLAPALTAAAARCPVPVELTTELPRGRRFAAAVENTAYFVVTEALTNVAKHARADHCEVTVTVDERALFISVRDDGCGGAHPGKGHGLAGLIDRLAAVEGRLDVHSPPGGPTTLTAEVPLSGVGEH
ncbi:sensor histidine kinase [Embleya sp. NPDC127516]|uniref:sensor histidine kinase n=1 Tax=Embleya sp. NPDC127516 TaxID=3363990 RepID=UPI00380AA7B3